MNWTITYRADPYACALADRHYSRQRIGTPCFMPPGRALVLIGNNCVWGTSWPYAEYVNRKLYKDAWVCSIFRNEGPYQSSQLIREAVAATRWKYGDAPAGGMVTMINRKHVRPIKRRGVATWGYTWKLAGFEEVGETLGGLLILRLTPGQMPEAQAPLGVQLPLIEESV